MRLIELEFFNFKQYYGRQSIQFAGQNDNDKQNVTVIYGENGRGKTTIYRALLFCLYGMKFLDQDQNYDFSLTDNPDIYITNLKALDEDFRGEKRGINCYVKAQFKHKDKLYVMERGLYSIQVEGNEIVEEDNLIKLSITGTDGNVEVLDESNRDEINRIINAIINHRVAYFFLFDGERIERLTKATREQKNEVAKGIRSLLKIDNLETALKALNQLDSKINRELQKVSTGKFLKKLKEIEDRKEKIEKNMYDYENNQNELNIALNHKQEIEKELNKFGDKKELIKKRNEIENGIETLELKKMSLKEQMRETVRKSSYILAKDAINIVSSDIDQKRVRGEVPSEIKKELIDKILMEMKCICGRDLKLHSPEHLEILQWSQRSSTQAFEIYMMDYYRQLGVTLEKIQSNSKEILDGLTRFGVLDEQIDEKRLYLETIKEEIGEDSDIDFTNKEKFRDQLLNKIKELELDGRLLEVQIEDLKSEQEKAKRESRELSKEENIKSDLTNKSEMVQNAIRILNEIRQNFIDEIVLDLQTRANENFQYFIDDVGKKNLKYLEINSDYTMEVLDWNDRPFLANISAGQRQVVSLAFITALAQTAGGNEVLELPLFMDTPFGRLGGAHRDNLLNLLPNITPQWVLLATETEFTTAEYKKLKDTGKWGKIYSLEAQNSGVTKIKEEEIGLFKPKR